MNLRTCALLLAVVVALCPAAAQMRGGRQTRGGTARAEAGKSELTQVLLTFDGTLRSVEKKQLRIDVANDQSLTFRRDRKTVFAQPGDSLVGKQVRVEAHRDAAGDLVAVRITPASQGAEKQD